MHCDHVGEASGVFVLGTMGIAVFKCEITVKDHSPHRSGSPFQTPTLGGFVLAFEGVMVSVLHHVSTLDNGFCGAQRSIMKPFCVQCLRIC